MFHNVFLFAVTDFTPQRHATETTIEQQHNVDGFQPFVGPFLHVGHTHVVTTIGQRQGFGHFVRHQVTVVFAIGHFQRSTVAVPRDNN